MASGGSSDGDGPPAAGSDLGGLDFRREPRTAGRPLIQGVREGGFTISGTRVQGSAVVLFDRTEPWAVTTFDDLRIESFELLTSADPVPEVLLLGTGGRFRMVSPDLRAALKACGIVIESMDTRAACRTFNVLVAENRSVAAALIAV